MLEGTYSCSSTPGTLGQPLWRELHCRGGVAVSRGRHPNRNQPPSDNHLQLSCHFEHVRSDLKLFRTPKCRRPWLSRYAASSWMPQMLPLTTDHPTTTVEVV